MRFSSLTGLLLATLVVGLRAEEKPAGDPAKSANWLVEAMAEPPGESHRDIGQRAAHRDNGLSANPTSPYALPQTHDANPLSSYLANWMTPRDIEILKLKEAAESGAAHMPSSGRGRPGSGAPEPVPRPNPYLVDLTPPTTAAAKIPTPAAAPAPASLAPPASKNDAAPAKSPGPPADLIKAQEDQKYFPQLKRF